MSGPLRPEELKPEDSKKRKRWPILVLVALVAAAIVVPPLVNLNRYQRRIADSISQSLGRQVEMSSVHLVLLPRPALQMSDFVVEEDPAFGAEPTLRSPSVSAYPRLSSLWRGRLEVGRISLEGPSLNLVHEPHGRWNIGSILVQTSHISTAPTGQRHPGRSQRFPYIEASSGRINFKEGLEKRPFSLLNADFSMWLENPGDWRVRIEGQPVRTDLDLDLADTGLLRVEGSLRAAPQLGQMPLHMTASWSKAPLGEAARLLLGHDISWRGALDSRMEVSGDADALRVNSRLRIDGLHRQEFIPPELIDLEPTCQFVYRRDMQAIDDLDCRLPTGGGSLRVKGSIERLSVPIPKLAVTMDRIPVSLLLRALRTAHQGLASGVQADGVMNGAFEYDGAAPAPLTGGGRVTGLTMSAPNLSQALTVPAIHLLARTPAVLARKATVTRRRHRSSIAPAPALPTAIEIAPFSPQGHALTFSGELTRSGFELHAEGAPPVAQLTALAASFGPLHSSVAGLGAQGTSVLDLTMRGQWTTPAGSVPQPLDIRGMLRLKDAVYTPKFLAGAVTVTSAQAIFSPSEVVWAPLDIVYGRIPISMSMSVPRGCTGAACTARFNASAATLDLPALERALSGGQPEGALGKILTRIDATLGNGGRRWPAATGFLRVNTLTMGPLTVRNATAALAVDGREIKIGSLDGRALGGNLHASGSATVGTSGPVYAVSYTLTGAALRDAAAPFGENWGGGNLDASGDLRMEGWSQADLASSASGAFTAEWNQGTSTALGSFDRWTGNGKVSEKSIVISRSKLARGGQAQSVSGTIGFDRMLDLSVGPVPATHLTGSLQPAR